MGILLSRDGKSLSLQIYNIRYYMELWFSVEKRNYLKRLGFLERFFEMDLIRSVF